RVVAFGPPRDVAGRSRGADRRNGEEGVRRPYERPDRACAQARPGARRPRRLLRGPGHLLLGHVHAAGGSELIQASDGQSGLALSHFLLGRWSPPLGEMESATAWADVP